MNDYELIDNFLTCFFNYEHYATAIKDAKEEIINNPNSSANWKKIILTIRRRELIKGQAISLVRNSANQFLREDSEEEAYRWLDKMIENIERNDDIAEQY